jgi:hypothetical protein
MSTGPSNTVILHFKETVVAELQAAQVGFPTEQVVSIVCEMVSEGQTKSEPSLVISN